jgi:hypothetical protein
MIIPGYALLCVTAYRGDKVARDYSCKLIPDSPSAHELLLFPQFLLVELLPECCCKSCLQLRSRWKARSATPKSN